MNKLKQFKMLFEDGEEHDNNAITETQISESTIETKVVNYWLKLRLRQTDKMSYESFAWCSRNRSYQDPWLTFAQEPRQYESR